VGPGLRGLLRGTLTVALCAVLSACSTRPPLNFDIAETERATAARTITETATRVAVSKVGAKVCRRVAVGISEHDWIRGVVTNIEANKIRVRIEDPGRFPQVLDGTTIARGALISDSPLNWVPCV
jgi:hypothetical protein